MGGFPKLQSVRSQILGFSSQNIRRLRYKCTLEEISFFSARELKTYFAMLRTIMLQLVRSILHSRASIR